MPCRLVIVGRRWIQSNVLALSIVKLRKIIIPLKFMPTMAVFVEQQNGKMQYVSDLVIEGVGDAHWENVSSNGEIQPWDGEKTFLGVLIKRDDKYVGYATIMIERPENNWRYNATIINCKELSPEERSNSEIMPEDLYKMIDSAIESAK